MLVLVTDGQVGNEDNIMHQIGPLLSQTRIHVVGIDRAVNAGFLSRLTVREPIFVTSKTATPA